MQIRTFSIDFKSIIFKLWSLCEKTGTCTNGADLFATRVVANKKN